MFEALRKMGSLAGQSLESIGTPIDERYSVYICACTGSFAIVEFSRKKPDEKPRAGFRAPKRRWLEGPFRLAYPFNACAN
jgi:hypothetical protein